MTERMSDERLAELRRWHDEWSHAEMLAEIDRARAAEAELRAEVERVREVSASHLHVSMARLTDADIVELSRAIDRAQKAEMELARARALVNAISDLPGETEERLTYEQCAEYARYLYNDARESGCDAEEAAAERDRLRAVVVAQADAWDEALVRASGFGDRAIRNADWQAACSHTEELGRELRGKP